LTLFPSRGGVDWQWFSAKTGWFGGTSATTKPLRLATTNKTAKRKKQSAFRSVSNLRDSQVKVQGLKNCLLLR